MRIQHFAVLLLAGLLLGGTWVQSSSAVPITISGTIRYPAATGNDNNDTANALTLKPVRGAKVELWDDNTLLFNLPPDFIIGTTYTSDTGNFSFMVDDSDSLGSLLAGTLDPYLAIYPATQPVLPAVGGVKSEVAMYVAGPLAGPPNNRRDTVGPQYLHVTAPAANIPPGANYTINVDLGSVTNTHRSFAAFDAMIEASRYYSSLPGSVNNSVQALFPTGEQTSNFSQGRMHILQGDRYDWDVAMHEYGHYVQSKHAGMSNSPGGGHGDNNLRFSRGAGGADLNMAGTNILNRREANQLAWGEGWATYFAISGQRESNSAALGIQRVGDTVYHDNRDRDGQSVGLRDGVELKTIGGPSLGEDNELSVIRILYDLYDANNEAAERDRVTLGDDAIWNVIRNNSTDTLDKFWNTLISQPGTTNSKRIDYGAIFEAQNVSPQPDDTSVPDGTIFPLFDLNQPTFKWKIPTGGQRGVFNTNLLSDFGLLFINSADFIIWDTGLLGNVTQFTPAPLDWLQFTATPDIYRWVVYGRETTQIGGMDYITGDFWSDARFFGVFVPEPASATLTIVGGFWLLTLSFGRRRENRRKKGDSHNLDRLCEARLRTNCSAPFSRPNAAGCRFQFQIVQQGSPSCKEHRL